VEDASSAVVDRKPHVEQLEADGRHHEEIHTGDQVAVVPKEGDPALLLARIWLGLGEVARDRGETHPHPELR
jgi:hypothetical protein